MKIVFISLDTRTDYQNASKFPPWLRRRLYMLNITNMLSTIGNIFSCTKDRCYMIRSMYEYFVWITNPSINWCVREVATCFQCSTRFSRLFANCLLALDMDCIPNTLSESQLFPWSTLVRDYQKIYTILITSFCWTDVAERI